MPTSTWTKSRLSLRDQTVGLPSSPFAHRRDGAYRPVAVAAIAGGPLLLDPSYASPIRLVHHDARIKAESGGRIYQRRRWAQACPHRCGGGELR